MTTAAFADFYHAVHGRDPFPWQLRLADRALTGDWPEVLDLPTASGKTSVLDVAVFALASQAGRPVLQRTAPLRIFYVIDRRLVVDEVTAHALKIARALADAIAGRRAEPVLRTVAEGLLSFQILEAPGDRTPLRVAAMRGGLYRNDAWAERPDQPLICVSTVDQVGSRLLFRGYGLNEYRWPVHAGLIGCDSLFFVDEAHLSVPFCGTLQAVARYQQWVERTVAQPIRLVCMSATPGGGSTSFGLDKQDRACTVLRKRLTASKPAELIEARDFEVEMVAQAERLAAMAEVRIIGLIANRVGSARRIYESLVASNPGQAILLTGRNRPFVRDAILKTFEPFIRAGDKRLAPPGDRLYVVSTQTVEVGANLDFDALLTEAAPLSALRQRFGRLNRLGERQISPAVIIRRKGEKNEDPVYGSDLSRTWEWLIERAEVVKEGRRQKRIIDFGVDSLARLLDECAKSLDTRPRSPVLLPAHLDLWSQTSPVAHPNPDVAPFLHGADTDESADVQVVWRGDLDDSTVPRLWLEIVGLAPPLLREALPVPIWAVRRWLQADERADQVSDLGRSWGPVEVRGRNPKGPVLVWQGPERSKLAHANEVAPGDTIVVPSSYGGADQFGWKPVASDPVLDCGDSCTLEMASLARGRRRVARLRLHPHMLTGLPAGVMDEQTEAAFEKAWKDLKTRLEGNQAGQDDDLEAAVDAVLAALPEAALPAGSTRDLFRGATGRSLLPYPQNTGLLVTVTLPEDWAVVSPWAEPEIMNDGTDEDDLPPGTGPVSLASHQAGVARLARTFGRNCGLDETLVTDLTTAAEAHDLGKRDPRTQLFLYGGDLLAFASATEAIAKSAARFPLPVLRRIREASGLPKGARHEFLSVALLQSDQRVLAGCDDPDLVLYLVGTHHGRGRPMVPVIDDPEPAEVTVEFRGHSLRSSSDHRLWRLASGWGDRYWRLVARYGHWGLSYLEAILRLADGMQSRLEEEGAGQT